MSVSIPANLRPFVEQTLAKGRFSNESEFVATLIAAYQEMENRNSKLKKRLKQSLRQVEAGEVSPLDMNAIKLQLRQELDEFGNPS